MECYLDNSATTAVSPEAAALALHIMTEEYGNPSSLHRRGFLAERAMTEARGQVAAVLHCRPEEIIFTAGGTESNNIALLGAARAMKRRGNRIVTTAVEHHSILAICIYKHFICLSKNSMISITIYSSIFFVFFIRNRA